MNVTAYVVGPNLRPSNWEDILANHGALVLGDLPAAPEDDVGLPKLREWIQRGGKLLFFPGWKDHALLRANGDLFGIEIEYPPRIDPHDSRLEWASDARPIGPEPPPVRYLYKANLSGGELLATAGVSKSPAIVRRATGQGLATVILGVISLPSGGGWLLNKHFAALLHFLLGGGSAAGEVISQSRGLSYYGGVLELLAAGDAGSAVDLMFASIPALADGEPLLAGEMCRVMRWAARAKGDTAAVLFSLRFLKEAAAWLHLGQVPDPLASRLVTDGPQAASESAA